MAHIDGKRFHEIIQRYNCESKVFGYVRRYILYYYNLNDCLQSGRCLIIVYNESKRKLFFLNKYRFFELEFVFWGIPEESVARSKSLILLDYIGAEEISEREFNKRATITKPEDEILREAEEIINPIYKS